MCIRSNSLLRKYQSSLKYLKQRDLITILEMEWCCLFEVTDYLKQCDLFVDKLEQLSFLDLLEYQTFIFVALCLPRHSSLGCQHFCDRILAQSAWELHQHEAG